MLLTTQKKTKKTKEIHVMCMCIHWNHKYTSWKFSCRNRCLFKTVQEYTKTRQIIIGNCQFGSATLFSTYVLISPIEKTLITTSII